MTKIVIYKMSQLPDNVAIDKPITSKPSFDDPIFFKKAYAKSNGSDRKKTRKKPVENKDQKRYFVLFYFESFVNNSSYDLNKKE
jgi:hypothetical protein